MRDFGKICLFLIVFTFKSNAQDTLNRVESMDSIVIYSGFSLLSLMSRAVVIKDSIPVFYYEFSSESNFLGVFVLEDSAMFKDGWMNEALFYCPFSNSYSRVVFGKSRGLKIKNTDYFYLTLDKRDAGFDLYRYINPDSVCLNLKKSLTNEQFLKYPFNEGIVLSKEQTRRGLEVIIQYYNFQIMYLNLVTCTLEKNAVLSNLDLIGLKDQNTIIRVEYLYRDKNGKLRSEIKTAKI